MPSDPFNRYEQFKYVHEYHPAVDGYKAVNMNKRAGVKIGMMIHSEGYIQAFALVTWTPLSGIEKAIDATYTITGPRMLVGRRPVFEKQWLMLHVMLLAWEFLEERGIEALDEDWLVSWYDDDGALITL